MIPRLILLLSPHQYHLRSLPLTLLQINSLNPRLNYHLPISIIMSAAVFFWRVAINFSLEPSTSKPIPLPKITDVHDHQNCLLYCLHHLFLSSLAIAAKKSLSNDPGASWKVTFLRTSPAMLPVPQITGAPIVT